MKQQEFEHAHQSMWAQLEAAVEPNKKSERDQSVYDRLPAHYRQLCHQLAIAKHRRYSPAVVNRLNNLVVACHNIIYAQSTRFRYQWLRFFIVDFPRALYVNRRYLWWSILLFVGPGLLMGILCYENPNLIYSLMDWAQVRGMEDMYNPDHSILGRERQADSDLLMFGFYIRNNIGIAFRTFAGGILFGIGTLFFIIYNGVLIGAVAGHLTQLGYIDTFYPFVVGHGAFELTAIVLSGAAGLRLGMVLLSPGAMTRGAALRMAAREVVQILLGAAAMLVIAAFIEAFWSSKASLPLAVKYGVGALLWTIVLGYLYYFARRNRDGSQ